MTISIDKYCVSQRVRSQLFRFDNGLVVDGYKLVNNIVYYRICHFTAINTDEISMTPYHIRYSDLYGANIQFKHFPPRTWFKYTSKSFIAKRSEQINQWLRVVLEQGECDKLLVELKNHDFTE